MHTLVNWRKLGWFRSQSPTFVRAKVANCLAPFAVMQISPAPTAIRSVFPIVEILLLPLACNEGRWRNSYRNLGCRFIEHQFLFVGIKLDDHAVQNFSATQKPFGKNSRFLGYKPIVFVLNAPIRRFERLGKSVKEIGHRQPPLSPATLADKHRFDMPYFLRILRDRAITGKLAHAGYVENGFPGPFIRLVVEISYPILARHVRGIVSQ